MRFGVKRTQAGEFARPDVLVELVAGVHNLGYDSFWLGDHVAFPRGMDTAHKKGSWRTDPREDFLEAIATAGVLLGRVDELPIGIHALIAPYRNPVVAGKAIASLDHLSQGRMRLAVTAGWIEEVFPILGAPDFASRGSVIEEYVAVLREMWRDGVVSFEGAHYSIPPTDVMPVPYGGRTLPILMGGHTPAAVRRAGRLGDGWAAARVSPANATTSIAEFRRAADEAGRDTSAMEIVVEVDLTFPTGGDDDGDEPPEETTLRSVDGVRSAVAAYRAAGVSLLLLNPMATTADQALADLVRFRSIAFPEKVSTVDAARSEP
jgi:probable F420-dependent oxidoreductase